MQQPQVSWHDLPLRERIELTRWLCFFPALTVMLLLRRDLGYRTLGPLGLLGVSGVMFLLGSMAAANDESAPLLQLFAVAFFFCALGQRAKRKREMRRGIAMHSYYVGDSVLERLPWPGFLKRDRRIGRFFDPAVCLVAGLLMLRIFPTFGLWIAFSGLCLRFFEDSLYRKQMEREMDVIDSIVASEVQVETLEQHPAARERGSRDHAPAQGIPTGLGPDIEEAILRRKTRRADLN